MKHLGHSLCIEPGFRPVALVGTGLTGRPSAMYPSSSINVGLPLGRRHFDGQPTLVTTPVAEGHRHVDHRVMRSQRKGLLWVLHGPKSVFLCSLPQWSPHPLPLPLPWPFQMPMPLPLPLPLPFTPPPLLPLPLPLLCVGVMPMENGQCLSAHLTRRSMQPAVGCTLYSACYTLQTHTTIQKYT